MTTRLGSGNTFTYDTRHMLHGPSMIACECIMASATSQRFMRHSMNGVTAT